MEGTGQFQDRRSCLLVCLCLHAARMDVAIYRSRQFLEARCRALPWQRQGFALRGLQRRFCHPPGEYLSGRRMTRRTHWCIGAACLRETRDLAPVQASDGANATDHAMGGRIRMRRTRRIDECFLQHLFRRGKRHTTGNGKCCQGLHQRLQCLHERRVVERDRGRRAHGRFRCFGLRGCFARGHRNSLRRRSAEQCGAVMKTLVRRASEARAPDRPRLEAVVG